MATIDEAAAELGVSRRQMYVLLQRFRAGSGRGTGLMPASGITEKGLPRSSCELFLTIHRKESRITRNLLKSTIQPGLVVLR